MKHYAIRLIVALFTFATGLTLATLLQASRSDADSTKRYYKQKLLQAERELRTSGPSCNLAEREILQMEREYIQAHINRDTAALDNILADEFTIESRRMMENKAQRLELLERDDFAFKAINTDNVQVEVDGDHATVRGEAFVRSRYGDEESTGPLYKFSRRYEKRQGRWQIVSVRVGR
jgi:ketosteroid isomerase-like protein